MDENYSYKNDKEGYYVLLFIGSFWVKWVIILIYERNFKKIVFVDEKYVKSFFYV